MVGIVAAFVLVFVSLLVACVSYRMGRADGLAEAEQKFVQELTDVLLDRDSLKIR